MTNDKQVEAWRAEFESTIDKPHLLHRFQSGTYCWDSTEWMWAGFQRAKRSMQQIELPSGHGMTISYREGISDAKDAIAAAGYSYRVKE